MILNPYEAILCETDEEFIRIGELLEQEGYQMFDPVEWPSLAKVGRDLGKYRRGYRWFPGHQFPACVATVGEDMGAELRETGKIICDEDMSTFSWRWSTDLLRMEDVHVEDLL